MKQKNKKIKINNSTYVYLQKNWRKDLVKGVIYLIISLFSAFCARCMVDDNELIVGWVFFFCAFIVFTICTLSQFLKFILMCILTKPTFYKYSVSKISNDIQASIFSVGKTLHNQNGKTVVKTTLLNSKMIICCFDITEDDRHSNFSNDILLARKIEKQRRNVGYVVIFNVKCSNLDIKKFMEHQSLDNYALCDLRCFYFADKQELITVYDKKADFCKQVTERLVNLLNSSETVDITSGKI